MFRGPGISDLVTLFECRMVYLWHACQLKDFRSYIAVGGIPSRALLDHCRLPFTTFATDDIDRTNGVWDKVFVNLSDFGDAFAKGRAATPNAYGPIMLRLSPVALAESDDVAVCPRSAGGRDFDREAESWGTVEEVDRLFARRRDPAAAKPWELAAQSVGLLGGSSSQPEVSLSCPASLIPMRFVTACLVDEIRVNSVSLVDVVRTTRTAANHDFPVWTRRYATNRRSLLSQLVESIQRGSIDLNELQHLPDVSPLLVDWAESLLDRDLSFMFKRFARYLQEGTLTVSHSVAAPSPSESVLKRAREWRESHAKYAKMHNAWSIEDTQRLRELVRAGRPYYEMSAVLQRPFDDIRFRLMQLGILPREPN